MGVVVAFDYAGFIAQFPEFTAISEQQATLWFNTATILHRNDGGGPVTQATIQSQLLNLATAHLLEQFLQSQNDPQPGQAKDANTPVGRISQASEGTVSGSFDYGTVGRSEAFWVTTKYGALYWSMTRPYRTIRYMPGFRRIANPWPPFGG